MKYLREAKYNAGFYAGYMGRGKVSKNADYTLGYTQGVSLVQIDATERKSLEEQLALTEKARADWQKAATTRGALLEQIQHQIGEVL